MKKSITYLAAFLSIVLLQSCASAGKNKIGCPSFTSEEIQQKETDFVKASFQVHLKEDDLTTIYSHTVE